MNYCGQLSINLNGEIIILKCFAWYNGFFFRCDDREPSKKMQSALSPDNMMMDAESAVMDNFDFLSSEHVVDDEEENMR